MKHKKGFARWKKPSLWILGFIIFCIGGITILETFRELNMQGAKALNLSETTRMYLGTWSAVGFLVNILWCLLFAVLAHKLSQKEL